MAKKIAPLLPAAILGLQRFGERLRLARKRRRLTAKQVAERAGMTAVTLRKLEEGGSGVTIGAYLAVMQVLGIEGELDKLASEDVMGRELQDARLSEPRRHTPIAEQPDASKVVATHKPKKAKPDARAKEQFPAQDSDWVAGSDFVSADALAGLITTPKRSRRARK